MFERSLYGQDYAAFREAVRRFIAAKHDRAPR